VTAAARSCEGKVALVTGASRGGTGTAIAVRLAAEGARVAITARDAEGLEATRARIDAVGGTGLVLPADLADPLGARCELVERTEDALGPIDILVNDATTTGFKPFDAWTLAELEVFQQVNVWAPWQLMAQVVPGMRRRGQGWIVNLTSLAAELPPGPPFPDLEIATGAAGYGVTKAALNRLTLAVAAETAGEGISVNALTPVATIATPKLVAAGVIEQVGVFEPVETMAEAALALCTADPGTLTARIAYSLQLLVELDRPVYDLEGRELVEGWQPRDLRIVIDRQTEMMTGLGWPNAYDFHRPSSGPPVR
jgi:NAD(P)-dependent dehydrogenase (short-subunit alcohol dehydrogenase family)